MIPDVRLQRTDRRIARVGQSIRLDLIRFSFHQQRGLLQIGHRILESTDGDVSMPAMPEHARIVGKLADSVREDIDGLAIAAQVCQAASEPDDGVGAVRIRFEIAPGHGERFLALLQNVGREGRADERFPQQRGRFDLRCG